MLATLSLAVLAALCCFSTAEASIKIDFDSVPLGAAGNGTVVYNQGGFSAWVSNHEGSIANDSLLNLDGNYLSSVDPLTPVGENDYSVSIDFSQAIWGLVSLEAAYFDQNGIDFRVKDSAGAEVFAADNGSLPNPKLISFLLPNPTTKLIFRDNNQLAVAIDNLMVQAVPEAGSLLVWSAAGIGILGLMYRRRSQA